MKFVHELRKHARSAVETLSVSPWLRGESSSVSLIASLSFRVGRACLSLLAGDADVIVLDHLPISRRAALLGGVHQLVAHEGWEPRPVAGADAQRPDGFGLAGGISLLDGNAVD